MYAPSTGDSVDGTGYSLTGNRPGSRGRRHLPRTHDRIATTKPRATLPRRHTSIREPTVTVRSPGRPKYSAASAVMYDVAMNRCLRHGAIVGAEPFFSSIFDRK